MKKSLFVILVFVFVLASCDINITINPVNFESETEAPGDEEGTEESEEVVEETTSQESINYHETKPEESKYHQSPAIVTMIETLSSRSVRILFDNSIKMVLSESFKLDDKVLSYEDVYIHSNIPSELILEFADELQVGDHVLTISHGGGIVDYNDYNVQPRNYVLSVY